MQLQELALSIACVLPTRRFFRMPTQRVDMRNAAEVYRYETLRMGRKVGMDNLLWY